MWLVSRRLMLRTGVSCLSRACCALRPDLGSSGHDSAKPTRSGHKPSVMRFITDDAKLDVHHQETQWIEFMPSFEEQAAEEDMTDMTQRHMEALIVVHGQERVMDAAGEVVHCVKYAVEKYRGPGTTVPDLDPRQQLHLSLEDTLFQSVSQDVDADVTFKSYCAELDDYLLSGDFRRYLQGLDCDVQLALMYAIPALEAWSPEVARGIRLLRAYHSKIRPLLVAALSGGDEGPKGDGDRGLQAAADGDVGGETSSRV